LQGMFQFLEAGNGVEAIAILEEHQNQIDLILLDIIMPEMDGKEFLQYKKKTPQLDGIPVIMITADDSSEQQISTLTMGANDYIVKPFIPEIVVRRVKNVLESNRRFREMIREYNDMSEQIKTDLMTGLLNRASVEKMVTQYLESTEVRCAMIMLDIDNFKKINDSCGHSYGDKVICAVAEKLRSSFRKEDIVARMGGDEFAVFIGNSPDMKLNELKAHELCRNMHDIQIEGKNAAITCSVGIAISSEKEHSFEKLYQNADKALYNAKYRGRDMISSYGKEMTTTVMTNWINDAEGVLDAINEGVYVCDKDTYELIYVNEYVCSFSQVDREECKGKKCYEVLQHRDTPCEFCPLSKMSEEKVYTRLFRVPNTAVTFLMRGRNINWNGTMVHLEVAVDVSKVENMNQYLEGKDHEEQ
ncbi:MAG: diguanylate cyclase, partial [Lachnospiraceae bacterium]